MLPDGFFLSSPAHRKNMAGPQDYLKPAPWIGGGQYIPQLWPN